MEGLTLSAGEVMRTKLNLDVLKRKDRQISRVLAVSNYTIVYEYPLDAEKWKKCGVEGGMFLVERRSNPTHALFILNRMNSKDFVMPLSPNISIEETENFVILTTHDERVRGFWFNDKAGREIFMRMVRKVTQNEHQDSSEPGQQGGKEEAKDAEEDLIFRNQLIVNANRKKQFQMRKKKIMQQLAELVADSYPEDEVVSFPQFNEIIRDLVDDEDIVKSSWKVATANIRADEE